MAIDLGSANTIIYVDGKGIALREPTLAIQHKKTKRVVAIGAEAKKMLGKLPASLETVRPLRAGVIADFDVVLTMLSGFVRRVQIRPDRKFFLERPRIIIGIPTQSTEVERRAVLDLTAALGARETLLVEEPLVAAIGAGAAIDEPVGTMVVDIGSGSCEIAAISLGGIVVGRSLKIAGDTMDADIINYVRLRYALALGEKTVEEIKILLGSAWPLPVEKEMVVRGRDLERGLPKTIRINSGQVREALAPTLNTIVGAIVETIEDTPPELVSDIAERGIILTGGGSLLYGLPKLVSAETKMPVTLANDPLSAVVGGCAALLKNEPLLKKVKIAID